jgi:hypothetical protein
VAGVRLLLEESAVASGREGAAEVTTGR